MHACAAVSDVCRASSNCSQLRSGRDEGQGSDVPGPPWELDRLVLPPDEDPTTVPVPELLRPVDSETEVDAGPLLAEGWLVADTRLDAPPALEATGSEVAPAALEAIAALDAAGALLAVAALLAGESDDATAPLLSVSPLEPEAASDVAANELLAPPVVLLDDDEEDDEEEDVPPPLELLAAPLLPPSSSSGAVPTTHAEQPAPNRAPTTVEPMTTRFRSMIRSRSVAGTAP